MSAAARLATLRMVRTPRSLVPAVLWIVLAMVAAFVERSRPVPAAGHVLLGAFGALALPLLVYALVGATLAGQSLSRATRPLVAFGASPFRIAGATLVVAALASAVLSALLAASVATLAHGLTDPPLVRDALTTAWIGALAGASYAAYFALGAATFKSGVGRGIFLAIDWIMGSGSTASAVLTPRAHLRSLLGGEPVMDFSQRASAVALVVVGLIFAIFALALVRRQRA